MTSRFVLPFADIGSGITPSDGAKLTFKNPGLETLKATFSDAAGLTPNANPVIADATGLFSNIYIKGNYDVVLQDKNNVQIWVDSVSEFATTADATRIKNFDTLALAVADTELVKDDTLITGDRGGATWDVVLSSTVTENTFNIVQGVGVGTLSLVLRLNELTTINEYGGDTTGVSESTTVVGIWLDSVIAGDIGGHTGAGTFLIDTITKAINDGINLSGPAIFKATGSNRLSMIRFTGTRGKVNMDGITVDGNDIVARPFAVENDGSTSSTLGEIYIGPGTRFINAKNNTPDTNTASGCFLRGGFTKIVFEGEVDDVESTSTSGAVCEGLVVTHFTTNPTDYVKSIVITSAARFRNVRNSNSSVADADGLKVDAPITVDATLSVAPGALFEECEGRAIKSQMLGNCIDSPIIRRSLYDGLIEINLQYSGGYVRGARVFHDGVRTNSIIGLTQRLAPANTQCSVSDNELTVIGSPGSNTGAMVETDVNDATVKVQGITIRDNKVKGAVDTMVSSRVANVVDVNRIVIDGNWAETIGVAFLTTTLFGSARAQLTVVCTNNGCENGCTGASITNDLKVEQDYNNANITPLLSTPFTYTVASGVLVVTGGEKSVRVSGEGGGSDDVDTITMTNYSPDEQLTLYNNTGNTITYKDGVGNLKLAGGDAALSSINDRLVVAFDGTNVCEVSRSINGA